MKEEKKKDSTTEQGGQSMNALTVTTNQIEQKELTPDLFNAFVSWIDRGEKTTRTYLTNLKAFLCWMRYKEVRNPQRQDIISYRQWLSAEHDGITLDPDSVTGWKYRTDRNGEPVKVSCRPATIRAYLQTVCQFFKWTASAGLYPDIASNIHAPKTTDTHHKEALQPAEVLRIEESIKEQSALKTHAAQEAQKDTAGRMQRSTEQGKRLYAIYLLAVNAGLRTIEIHRANVKDLQTRDGQTVLYIWGKGHAEPDQKKPIAPEVAEAIRDYLNSRTDHPTGNSPLFVSTGNRSGGRRIATTTLSTMLKRAMQAAGFNSERITAHSLRHTAGTAVQEITGDLFATQKYMRHSDPATTEIYLHNDTEKAEAGIAQQLYNLYHGRQEQAALADILTRLNPQQIAQLTGIAAAMA